MIVTARTRDDFTMFLRFMKERGVVLPYSADLQFIARMNKRNVLLGVVAYNGFIGNVCCMHCAGDGNWVSRELLRATFHYPFNTAGRKCILGPVSGNNKRALAFNRHLGFTIAHTVPGGWGDGEDLILMQMMRDKCRWIQETGNELKAA